MSKSENNSCDQNKSNEKIKPLFEDLQGHTQDDASYEKMMQKQKETAQKIADIKNIL